MDEKFRKMFLYGLKKVLTQSKFPFRQMIKNWPFLEDLIQYFKKFGRIEECKIYFENTNKKGSYKGYGFILFKDKDTMQKVLDEDEFHTINDCKFQCKPILLKDELKKVKEGKMLDLSTTHGNVTPNHPMSEHSFDGSQNFDDIDKLSVEMNELAAQSVGSMSHHYSQGSDYYTGNKYPTGYANSAYSNYSGYSQGSYGGYPQVPPYDYGY